jgi:Putative phage tail protein
MLPECGLIWEIRVWDPLTGQMLNMTSSGIFQAFPDRIARDGVPLSAVVTSLCARVGLAAGDIDVSELTDAVRGFSLARQVSIRGGLELLAVAYNFDCIESEFQLKFTKRGSSSIRVISQDELAYVSDPDSPVPELFLETRAQDVDLPARFTVRYNDIERDSDIGVQTVKRIVRPAATMQSQNEATLDLPLVLSAEEAKTIALRQGFAPWIERVHHQWRLPWTHIDIDPGDVVTIALDDGRSFEVRVLKVDIGANLELAWDTVVQESSTYDVSALTSGGLTYRRAIAAPTPATRLLIADSPLLADGDDAMRRSSGLYWAMGGIGQPGWSGGLVFESRDAAAFAIIDESTAEAAWGFCQNALGVTATPFGTDRANTLTVSMTAGGERLGTVSELEMLNGANHALIIDPDGTVEVIASPPTTLARRSSAPCCAACAAPRASSATTSSGRCSCCSRRTRSIASCCPWTSGTRSVTSARSAAAAS